MRTVLLLLFVFYFLPSFSQNDSTVLVPDPAKKIRKVEVSCGQCKFELPGKGCDLAVRIKGKSYFVDGTKIDSHGDAHSDEGFCNAVRKAEVQGEVVGDRFVVTYFKLLPVKIKKSKNSR